MMELLISKFASGSSKTIILWPIAKIEAAINLSFSPPESVLVVSLRLSINISAYFFIL